MGLEILDEGIDVLILIIIFNLGLRLVRSTLLRRLLVELSALDVGRQRRSAAGRVVRHWRYCWQIKALLGVY